MPRSLRYIFRALLLAIATFLFSAAVLSLVGEDNARAEEAPEEFLPIELTEEEKGRLDDIGTAHHSSIPPTGEVRNPAEWERSVGVLIRWPLGIPYDLIAEMSEELVVTTIVSSSYYQAQAESAYQANGVNMANVDFLLASTNSIWTRDYGPWFIFSEDGIGIVDHIYNRPRPYDDVIPQTLGAEWGIPVYGMDVIHTGGNHMSDGLGRSMSTRLVYDENPSLITAQVDSFMLAYLGNEYWVLDYIESGGIHHIDCWAKFLDPATILVKDVPPSSSSYALLNARAGYLSQQMSAWGRPYEVVRVYCPYGTAYTNSIILNGKVLVPMFGSASDDEAIQTYQEAMPGYEVLGFTGSWLDDDAIHCRVMGVPDRQMLFIHHVPLYGRIGVAAGEYGITVEITDCSRTGLIAESSLVRYRVDGGAWTDVPLVGAADAYDGFIPAQASGSMIEYFILAADNSGRVEKHPFIGAPGAHSFSVNAMPVIVSPDSFVCKIGAEFAYCPEVADADDTVHAVSYASYPAWLGVNGDSLMGTPTEPTEGTFTVSASDSFDTVSADVYVRSYLCGDIDDNGEGPNVADLTYLVAYLFRGGPEPPLPAAANINGNPEGTIEVSDLTALIAYLFRGGPAGVCG